MVHSVYVGNSDFKPVRKNEECQLEVRLPRQDIKHQQSAGRARLFIQLSEPIANGEI